MIIKSIFKKNSKYKWNFLNIKKNLQYIKEINKQNLEIKIIKNNQSIDIDEDKLNNNIKIENEKLIKLVNDDKKIKKKKKTI